MIFQEDAGTEPTTESRAMDRRSVVSGLGLAGLGLLASSTLGRAATFPTSPNVSVPTQNKIAAGVASNRIDLTNLPPDWARAHGSVIPDYARYIWSLKLKTISPAQLIEAHAKRKGQVWNTLPPKQWWVRMGYTLRVADRIALAMGVNQVEIISAYRSPSYNAHCDGAKSGSYHQANVAVDVKFPVKASLVTATARDLRDRGLFKGGVGGYWDFTHIDTRGENMNWQG